MNLFGRYTPKAKHTKKLAATKSYYYLKSNTNKAYSKTVTTKRVQQEIL
jgi:hypothetical protein